MISGTPEGASLHLCVMSTEWYIYTVLSTKDARVGAGGMPLLWLMSEKIKTKGAHAFHVGEGYLIKKGAPSQSLLHSSLQG